MNRSAVSVALVFVLTAMVMVLAGCEPAADTNRNANANAAASPAKETFNAAAIEAEVMKVGRDWLKAGETHDVEQIKRIVADDAILVYPDGSPGTKADEVRIAETKAITGEGWEILESKVTVLDADSAFATGRTRFKTGRYKEASMPKAIDISGDYRFVDVYARRNGNWQVIASAATKIAAPVMPSSAASPAASAPPPPPSPTATRTP